MNPNVYIIAGPNGVGKTTFAREFLPHYANCRIFINADLIAAGMSPLDPQKAAFRAGRLMLEEIGIQAIKGEDFGFETTLSGKGHIAVIHELKKRRYRVHIFYLWVPTAELTLLRIRERVSRGGHNVAEQVVLRRFGKSLRNFLASYRPLADQWMLFDNSGAGPAMIATGQKDRVQIVDAERYNGIVKGYDEL